MFCANTAKGGRAAANAKRRVGEGAAFALMTGKKGGVLNAIETGSMER
jgi:hypothetical protein